MSSDAENISVWAQDTRWRTIPEKPRALGELKAPDGGELMKIAFDTHRDIVTAIGYQAGKSANEALCACAATACSLAKDKAVMALDLIGPAEIAEALKVQMDDSLFYQAVLSVLCLKNALSSYADTRAADYAAFQQEQGKA